jgi:chorismate mutase
VETKVRGVRGAITATDAGEPAVADATRELLGALIESNGIDLEDLAATIFTLPEELAGANPALVARSIGFQDVPLLMVREHLGVVDVPRVIRVLLLWNTTRSRSEIHHVYLRDAGALRPDLAGHAYQEHEPEEGGTRW